VEFQIPRYFEAIPDADDKIHEVKEAYLSEQFQDAIHLLRNTTLSQVTGSYEEMFNELVMHRLNGYPIVGVWSDTIVPAAQDFMRWAKEIATKSDIPKFLATHAGDIALMALGSVQPEIAVALRMGLDHLLPQRGPPKFSSDLLKTI